MMTIQDLFRLGMDREIAAVVDYSALDKINLNLGAGNKVIPGAIPLDLPEWNADTDPVPRWLGRGNPRLLFPRACGEAGGDVGGAPARLTARRGDEYRSAVL